MGAFRYSETWFDAALSWDPWRQDDALSLLERLHARDTELELYLARTTSQDAWMGYTPTVKFGATTATIATNSTYVKLGQTCIANIAFRLVNLNGGTGNLTITLPVSRRAITDPANSFVNTPGTWSVFDVSTGTSDYTGVVTFNTDADIVLRTPGTPIGVMTHAVPFAVAAGVSGTGDEVYATVLFEATA